MPTTIPNQKTITIHRQKPEKDFLQIKNSHWMEVNKKYGPYALQLYLYLAKNADNYKFALSAQAAENEAGIRRTSFHKYLDKLIAEGYLVKRGGNTYDFYEVPQGKQEKPQDEQDKPPHDFTNPQEELECSPGSTEIYNRNTNNKDSKYSGAKDNVVAEPQAGAGPCTPEQVEGRIEEPPVRIVHIKPPERQPSKAYENYVF